MSKNKKTELDLKKTVLAVGKNDDDYSELTDVELDEQGLYTDDEWQRIVNERMQSVDPKMQEALQRWEDLEALREHYRSPIAFARDCLKDVMGFNITEIQKDIVNFVKLVVTGKQYGLIQAPRSQAKTTLVAILCVWLLIHDTRHRILIASAGSDVAGQISRQIIQIIMNWDILECMRPDPRKGDRCSNASFDIHWQLKGVEKAPSIASIGITSNMQGRRADTVIADDIESDKNSMTEEMREKIKRKANDFSAICQRGNIIYIGTPQTIDSIYRDLPSKGYETRIWTARYMSETEEKKYKGFLAPIIVNRMAKDPSLRTGGGIDGNQGQVVDTELFDEELLVKKEHAAGSDFFQLQYQLNTSLNDEQLYPLKLRNLIVMSFDNHKAPIELGWSTQKKYRHPRLSEDYELHYPSYVSETYDQYQYRAMFVDTAGGGANADETVAVVGYILHGMIYIAEMVAMDAGKLDENYVTVSKLAFKHKVHCIYIEKNFGYGAFAHALRPLLLGYYKSNGVNSAPSIEEPMASSQMSKEKRICDTLVPIINGHRMVISESVIEYDLESIMRYGFEKQKSYSLLHQISRLTREKGSLKHDDRVDCVAGLCANLTRFLSTDSSNRQIVANDDTQKLLEQWGAPKYTRQSSTCKTLRDYM